MVSIYKKETDGSIPLTSPATQKSKDRKSEEDRARQEMGSREERTSAQGERGLSNVEAGRSLLE